MKALGEKLISWNRHYTEFRLWCRFSVLTWCSPWNPQRM